MSAPRFSIVTPSFRNSDWLKLCVASVADQGVALEHIVQDACSDDGTQEWLAKDPRVLAHIEKDRGMYDAVNRGFRRARGDILAYLNCDEQYLPGALTAVWDYFQRNPAIEVVFAHAVVVDERGRYVCDRRVTRPTKYHSWVSGNLSILTAATFYRRSLVERRGLYFDTDRRVISDVLWVLKLIEQRVPMGVLNQFTSAFADTGGNLSLGTSAQRERTELLAAAPGWARLLRPGIVAHYRLRRLLEGHYLGLRPFEYFIYTKDSPAARVRFAVRRPTGRWKARH